MVGGKPRVAASEMPLPSPREGVVSSPTCLCMQIHLWPSCYAMNFRPHSSYLSLWAECWYLRATFEKNRQNYHIWGTDLLKICSLFVCWWKKQFWKNPFHIWNFDPQSSGDFERFSIFYIFEQILGLITDSKIENVSLDL